MTAPAGSAACVESSVAADIARHTLHDYQAVVGVLSTREDATQTASPFYQCGALSAALALLLDEIGRQAQTALLLDGAR